MAYRSTLRADALKLVAKKLRSSLAVEGELPEDGLAAYGDDGDDLMLALARKIVAGEEDGGWVESVFAQARQVAAEAEALLVDAEWAAPEPVAVEVHAHGNGHTAVPVGGNAGDDDTPERQRSLFSWAEFMAEEPAKPGRRSRRPAPASISLFEWALERERESVPAGVGCQAGTKRGGHRSSCGGLPLPVHVCGPFVVLAAQPLQRVGVAPWTASLTAPPGPRAGAYPECSKSSRSLRGKGRHSRKNGLVTSVAPS